MRVFGPRIADGLAQMYFRANNSRAHGHLKRRPGRRPVPRPRRRDHELLHTRRRDRGDTAP